MRCDVSSEERDVTLPSLCLSSSSVTRWLKSDIVVCASTDTMALESTWSSLSSMEEENAVEEDEESEADDDDDDDDDDDNTATAAVAVAASAEEEDDDEDKDEKSRIVSTIGGAAVAAATDCASAVPTIATSMTALALLSLSIAVPPPEPASFVAMAAVPGASLFLARFRDVVATAKLG